MSYDGMYSELSARGTSSQILTQVLEVRDQIVISENNVEVLEAAANNSAAVASNAALDAQASVASIGTSVADAADSASAAATSAANAAQSAIDAEFNSVIALATSEIALSTAQEANDISDSALLAANSAVTTANGIAGTANTALANSVIAVDDADAAVTTANNAFAAVAGKQDEDQMLTALSALTTSNDTAIYFQGADLPSLYTLTDLGRSLVGSANAPTVRTLLDIVDPPQSTLEGLDFYRSAAGTIKVGVGRAFIPSLSKTLLVNTELTLTLSGLTADTLYHIYLYSNSGVPTVEASSTAPVLYQAPSCYQKTGDNSRRYIGSFLALSATDCYKFVQCGEKVLYLENTSLLQVVAGSRPATSTNVSCSASLPITSASVQLEAGSAQNVASNLHLANPDMGSVSSGNRLMIIDNSTTGNFCSINLPVDSLQRINIIYDIVGASGGAFLRVRGYTFRR